MYKGQLINFSFQMNRFYYFKMHLFIFTFDLFNIGYLRILNIWNINNYTQNIAFSNYLTLLCFSLELEVSNTFGEYLQFFFTKQTL